MVEFAPTGPSEVDVPELGGFGPLVGQSAGMRGVFERLKKAAPTDLTVLVTGETGTGKELVAQAIHEASSRAHKPFVVVDCGSIPATLAESALFGHERGSFTGAVDKRVSPFVEADGGTIFLDELGELPIDVQPKLLRALAEGRIKSVGLEQLPARQRARHRGDAPRSGARGQRRHVPQRPATSASRSSRSSCRRCGSASRTSPCSSAA